MLRHLHHLGLVTAMLLSVTSTIKLPGNQVNWVVSAQAQTTQEQGNEAVRLNKLGLRQLDTGQVQAALQTFEQALSIFKAIGNRKSEETVLNNIGEAYRSLGQYPQALKYFEQALVIAKQVGDNAGVGTIFNNMGLVYDNLGQYPQALKYFEQAVVIYKKVGDKVGEGTTLNNIGNVYRSLGQNPLALKYYDQALVIHKEVGNKVLEGTTLNNIGTVYFFQGQYPQALKYYSLALVIHKEVGNKVEYGTTLNNMGAVYRDLGQYSQALKYYEQALVIYKEVGNKAAEGTILNNIGLVYENLGQYSQALKYYEQTLVIAKEVRNKVGVGATLNNMGVIYWNLGQYPQALKYYEQALVIHKDIGNRVMEASALNNIGAVYFSLQQYPNALKYYDQALVIRKEIDDNAGVGATLTNIGAVYNKLRKYTDAEKMLFAGIEIWESLRPGLTDASKIAIFETQAVTYRLLQQSLVAQNKPNNALEIAERGRARAFVELLASRQSPNPNNQIIIKSLDIQQIQQLAKTQNATLVEYSIVKDSFKNLGKEELPESSLYIWVVKPTGEVAFKQVDLTSLKTPLVELVTSSRQSIGVRGRGIGVTQRTDAATQAKQLQQLHQILIQPIAQFLPTEPNSRVIFIPQNELFLVPFAALQDELGKYLIEKHTILTAPAIQVLELTHQQRQRLRAQSLAPLQGKDVLVMGNPTMPSIPDATGKLEQLPSLPGAEIEAKAIAKLLNTQAIIGKDATKANILEQLKTKRIVHLATHGLLNDFKLSGVPGAIALAPSGQDNGLLTASEIFDLKLNAELVVLSACDTGRGDIKGDGVIGLSRSLISAGVSSIIVSLWSVPDAPTASLMTEFYRQISQNPDKATALRKAMLMTMKQYPKPKDWAAFTLIGEAE
jgi:CHAT domain-containing protein/Tfp pilus assembly protein PilF